MTTWTEEEFRATRGISVLLDPAYLMEDVGFEPDPWQQEFLRCAYNRVLLLCGRQHGKSTVVACRGLHEALYTPRSKIVCVSPSQRQSNELYEDKILGFYDKLGEPVPWVKKTSTQLKLANGSRILSLPGTQKTIRAFSAATTVIMDEAAQIDDALVGAVTPMLATTNGRLILLSTPYGARGLFHDYWTGDDPMWRRFKVTADQCKRISPEFLAAERRTLGHRMYSQEYMCEFLATLDQVFSPEEIDAAFDEEMAPFFAPESAGV